MHCQPAILRELLEKTASRQVDLVLSLEEARWGGKRKEQTATYIYTGEEGKVGERETNRVTGSGLGTASPMLHHTDVAFNIQKPAWTLLTFPARALHPVGLLVGRHRRHGRSMRSLATQRRAQAGKQ